MQKYLVGTLFDEEEQDKKTHLNNMKAKDPMGNTRWKGAFTGGFQAGYKNTCGTKEGWAPSTFVSSVYKRHEKVQNSIFDYMDKEDYGRESIAANISLNQNFQKTQKNSLNVTLQESIGQKILNKLKKVEAFNSAPQNIEDLQKLLQIYSKQQKINENNNNYLLKDLQAPVTVNSKNIELADDDFILAYEEFYRKVIRGFQKQETQEEIKKRVEENKVYFDFTKPLDEEPEYLREIQEHEEKPKKRKKNLINEQSLKHIFQSSGSFKQYVEKNQMPKPPEDYDPFHRIKDLNKAKFEQNLINHQLQKQAAKKIQTFNLAKRSEMLGEQKLSSKFVSSQNSSVNKFLRNDEKVSELTRFFEDEKKNQRYIDYVLELEGKKISAQLEHLSYEEAEREKNEFQKMYKLDQLRREENKLPAELQNALKKKQEVKDLEIKRTIKPWKPEKLLCKRFNVAAPYIDKRESDEMY